MDKEKKELLHKCPECSRSFATKAGLTRHMNLTHLTLSPSQVKKAEKDLAQLDKEKKEKIEWKRLPPYEGKIHQGCLCCPGVEPVACVTNTLVAVGFGDAHVSRDGEIIYQEREGQEDKCLEYFEAMAQKDPNHDWRLVLYAPLRGREYQRHGKNKWVLIDANMGFA